MDLLADNAPGEKDMSNTLLGKLISGENLISLGIMLITFSMGYAVLADDQDEHTISIAVVQQEQRDIRKAVQDVRTDVAVIRAKQQAVVEDYVEVKKDIKEVLEIIRENERRRVGQ